MADHSGASNSNFDQNSERFEFVKEIIAAQLKSEGIKLWLSPYTQEETGEVDHFPLELVERYSALFEISADVVANTLEILRENAVKKLVANKKFKASGIATVKLKLIGKPSGSAHVTKLETGLHVDGKTFRMKIMEVLDLKASLDDVRLICHGKLISNDTTLHDQDVGNNSVVMVMISPKETEETSRQDTIEPNPVSRTRHAASVLANKKRGGAGPYDDYFLEISDQDGKPLQLPEAEREQFQTKGLRSKRRNLLYRTGSLVIAMSLHEQGRRIVEQRKYAEALPLFLAADEKFRECRSEMLDAVDNYAILCLDIVWCYLQLKSIRDLPHAEEMLKKCEGCLRKSYGRNLERLNFLTGSTSKEKVLYVRLNLLQAICAFHKGDTSQASQLLEKVEKEIAGLKVDDAAFSQMISMGFDASESRLALRSSNGDITMAIGYISKKREEKQKQLKDRKEKRKKHKMSMKLGKTANGEWVDIDMYNNLCEMGYPDTSAKEALRQANNDMDIALQILNERPELLRFASSESSLEISDDLIAQVTSMGFDVDTSRLVLMHYHDVAKAIERLLETSGALPPECQVTDSAVGIVSNLDDPSDPESDSEDSEEVENALKDISSAFKRKHEESHLDLTLEEEFNFVSEYKTMIATRAKIEKKI